MTVRPLRYENGTLYLLDQRALPLREDWLAFDRAAEVARAIRLMVVRGAPAIGVSAAYGLALEAAALMSDANRAQSLSTAAEHLAQARPTAINLKWAVDRMMRVASDNTALSPAGFAGALLNEAHAIRDEDEAMCAAMGSHGAALLPPGATVLTHCNAGALATAGYGTALGVIRAAHEAGKGIRVLACETRPFWQGARLTAWELHRDGIPVELICDNMVAHFMAKGGIDAVVTGADRIAANGDAANKIGTLGVAILASSFGIPFYVAAPSSTYVLACGSGGAIPIEERDPTEVTHFRGERVAPEGVPARNPAFDVTPARLIAAHITERGVLRPPYGESIAAALAG